MSCCFGGGGVSKSLGALGEKLRGFGVLRRFLVVIMGGGGVSSSAVPDVGAHFVM